jgi:hypothetical protein
MRFATYVGGLLGAVLVVLASCAPVDGPEQGPAGGTDAAPKDAPPAALPESHRQRIEAAIRNVRQRELLTTNAFWTVFHGILGLGPGLELKHPQLQVKVNALEQICEGVEIRGLRFLPTKNGVDVQTLGDGVGQGHQDQFIAEMIQWSMPIDRKMSAQGQDCTFRDFVKHSQMRARVNSNQELSWTIIVVSEHYGTNASWTNEHGEKINFEDIVKYELEAPVESAACGGTHRLFGLTWAYHLHLQKGGKTEGVWKGVAERTAKYRDMARQQQNADGTFSTNYFRGWGESPDKQLRINTTGHIFEWLALALSDQELREPWVQKAGDALAKLILELQNEAIDSGSVYHAVHGLQIYYARVFDRSFCPPELRIPLPPGWGKAK